MILCLSFERGMVDMCIPGMFLMLGRRACCHCTCGEIGNKKLTLPVPAANALTQGGSNLRFTWGDTVLAARCLFTSYKVPLFLEVRGYPTPRCFGQRVRKRLKIKELIFL